MVLSGPGRSGGDEQGAEAIALQVYNINGILSTPGDLLVLLHFSLFCLGEPPHR